MASWIINFRCKDEHRHSASELGPWIFVTLQSRCLHKWSWPSCPINYRGTPLKAMFTTHNSELREKHRNSLLLQDTDWCPSNRKVLHQLCTAFLQTGTQGYFPINSLYQVVKRGK